MLAGMDYLEGSCFLDLPDALYDAKHISGLGGISGNLCPVDSIRSVGDCSRYEGGVSDEPILGGPG